APLALDRFVALEEPEAVALGVDAVGVPADRRDRLLVLSGATQLARLRDARVDVLREEVGHEPAPAVLRRVDRSARLAAVDHVVLDGAAPALERPAEEVPPESHRALGVACRELEMCDGVHPASLQAGAYPLFTVVNAYPKERFSSEVRLTRES